MHEPIPLPTIVYEGVSQLGQAVSGTTNTETVQQLVTRLYGGRWQALKVWRLDTNEPVGGIDRKRLRRGRAYWYDEPDGSMRTHRMLPDNPTTERA